MPLVRLPNYTPDISDLGTESGNNVMNLVPRGDGWGPFGDLIGFTAALPAPCRGYFFARRTDGTVAIFAGTSTDLYLLDNTLFTWTRVSKGGISYSAVVASDNWQFVQFNDLVIAVQVNTAPQKFILSSSTNFVDLLGTPPQSGSVAVVGFFVVLTNQLSNPKRVSWSDLSAPETWTAGVGLADFQDLPDGGSTLAVSGGDAYGLIFQEAATRSMVYAPGSPVVFQINRLSTQETLIGKYSIINVGNKTFYVGGGGFKLVENAGDPQPIGKEQVDTTFINDVDKTNLQLMIGAPDPQSTRVYWAYKSQAGSAGLFDKILLYDWALKRWGLIDMSGEYIASLARPGLTLEGLDAVAPGGITITNAVNNGAGLIRLTLSPGTTNGPFTVIGQNFIEVQGVVGTVEANGSWKINIINGTTIDLLSSAFVNAYISGGRIGGSLDALSFSLDSISKSAVAALSSCAPNNQLGFHTGPNLEGIVETSQIDGEGQMVFTVSFMPLTDCTNVVGSVGYRNNANAALVYTPENLIDDMGQISASPIESRYQRMKLRFPYASVWTYARGIHPDTELAGER